jgi:hypothetical protein
MSTDEGPGHSTSYDPGPGIRILFLSAKWLQFLLAPIAYLLLLTIALVPGALTAAGILYPILVTYAFLAVILSRLLYWLNQRSAHARRTHHALAIFRSLDGDRPPPYCLYLRPFLTSHGLQVSNSRFKRQFLPSMDRFYGRRIDLETVLAMAMERRRCPLIAIGDTGFKLGAAKVLTSDDQWQSVFTKLAVSAQAIVIVPLPRPGTIWELDHLVSQPQLLEKTLFVMPLRLRSGVQERLEPYWEEMRRSLQAKGIELPPLSPTGGFFTLLDGGASFHMIEGGGLDVDYVEQVMTGLLGRQSFESTFLDLQPVRQVALRSLLEAHLFVSRDAGKLAARPMPLFGLSRLSADAALIEALAAQGLLVMHRSQIGSQAWQEVNVHPAALQWPRLRSWVEEREDLFRLKGDIRAGLQKLDEIRDVILDSGGINDARRGMSERPTHAAYRDASGSPTFVAGLRPEEQQFLGEAS